MAHVVCVMKVEEKRVTFTWSEGPASFAPYTLDGMDYTQFKRMAELARGKLADLVKDYLSGEENVPQSTFELAQAGYQLHESLFCLGNHEAKQVRKWLEKLSEKEAVDTVEIVVDSPWSLPWNVIYDRPPTKDEFLGADVSPDRWRPFWGLKYNMCGGGGVNPLRRMPILRDPHVLVVVDPDIRDGLPTEQRERLEKFAHSHNLHVVHSKDELERAIQDQRPDVLYWLSHASPEALVLSNETVSPWDLLQLLRRDSDDDIRFGGLAFLNSCQTAEVAGEDGSFFEALHKAGFAGMIGTEHQTIDQFANPLGLDFLEAFLDQGETVGSAMRRLRGRVPLGLLYGTYCPPDIRVERGVPVDNVAISQLSDVKGVALGIKTAEPTATKSPSKPLPPLPTEPYRSLAYYDREDRALFAGRDDDIERFAMYLDDASTRTLVLHGESGVGKSSFLRAGVIPYLEEECLGYRFIRERKGEEVNQTQGAVMFVRATNDLFGQLAQALWDFCARPYEYETPLGEKISVNLPELLAEFLPPRDPSHLIPVSKGGKNWKHGPANYLQEDPTLLGRILSAISDRLPFSAILVIDQGEEVFTLAQTPQDQQRGQQALDMLQRTVGASGDFKVIFALRTEYYGRVIDRLRRGLHDMGSIREYLLTDFDQDDLVEAISRPTSATPLRYSSEIPFEKYRFRYEDGLPEEIARRVTAHSGGFRRGGVLPLVQVICGHLYERVRHREDRVVRIADLEELGGVEGGLQKHVEAMLLKLTRENPGDKKAFKQLLTRLYLRQPDGSLTTALLPEDDLVAHWRGRQPFARMLAAADNLRLLRVASLRIGGEVERRYVSLGHDSLSKLAAQWHEEFDKGRRLRNMAAVSLAVVMVVLLIACFAIWGMKATATLAEKEKEAAEIAATLATTQKEAAEIAATIATENERKTAKLLADTQAAQRAMRRARYADQLKLALTYREKHPVRMERALASLVPENSEDEDLRGFEWYFLKHSTMQDKQTIPTPSNSFFQVAWMPDPGAILTWGDSGVTYAVAPGPKLPVITDWKSLELNGAAGFAVALKAARFAVVSQNQVHLFELSTDAFRLVTELEIPTSMLSTSVYVSSTRYKLALSPDGKRVAIASRAAHDEADSQISYHAHVAVFDVDEPSRVAISSDPVGTRDQEVTSMAFTPTGELAVVMNRTGNSGQPAPVDLLIFNYENAELKPRKVELASPEETSTGRISFAVLNPAGDRIALYDASSRRIELLNMGESPGSGIRLDAPKGMGDQIRVLDIGFAADLEHVVVLVVSEQDPTAPFRAVWYVLTGKYEEVSMSDPLDNGMGGVFDIEERWPGWAAIQLDANGPRFLWKGNEGALRAIVPDTMDPSEKRFESPGGITYRSHLRPNPSGDEFVVSTVHTNANQEYWFPRLIDPVRLETVELGSREEWQTLRARESFVSDDGRYLVGTNYERNFFWIEIEENKLKELTVPPDLTNSDVEVLGFRPQHAQFYVSDQSENTVQRWDLTANGLSLGQTYRWRTSDGLFPLRWALTTNRIFLATNESIYAWNADTGERPDPQEISGKIGDLEMLGDGWHLATRIQSPPDDDHRLIIWDTRPNPWTKVCERKLPGGLSSDRYAIHPSGTRIVSAEMPGRLTFWDIGPWAEDVGIRELISLEEDGQVKNLIFSSDGQTLAGLVGTAEPLSDVQIWRAPGTPAQVKPVRSP